MKAILSFIICLHLLSCVLIFYLLYIPVMANEEDEGGGTHACGTCQVAFSTAAKLKYHKMTKHGAWRQSLACADCGRTYTSTSNLKRHQARVHTDARSRTKLAHVCSVCGHVSQDKFHLDVHQRKHSGQRPFECDKCPAAFYKKSDLKVHARRCVGPKHTCPSCQRKFVFRRQYEEHCVWSPQCGSLGKDVLVANEASDGGQRYMANKPTAVKLTLGSSCSIVAVGGQDLLESGPACLLADRRRRVACGLCHACLRREDCGRCTACSRGRKCSQRKCLSLLHVSRATVDILEELPFAPEEQQSVDFKSAGLAANEELNVITVDLETAIVDLDDVLARDIHACQE